MQRVLILIAAACVGASRAQALDEGSQRRMEAELDAFRAAYSTGFLGKLYLELTDSGGALQSGFGSVRPKTAGHKAGGPPESEIDLNGRIYLPGQTRMVVANGIPGSPTPRGWEFKSAAGWIDAYSEIPWGPPVRAVFEGKSRDLKDKRDLKALRAYLKGVPEAFARSGEDIEEAIRYFNAAPDAERVAHTEYEEDLEAKSGPVRTGYTSRMARAIGARLALNPNDLPALGMEAEALCADGRGTEAEAALKRIEAIRPDYYRIPLARATCLERSGRPAEAEAQFLLARKTCARGMIPDLLDRRDLAGDTRRYDSATRARGDRRVWLEWDALGFGIPQAMFGSSLSLHAKAGSCAASVTVGAGLAYFADPPAGFPAIDFRFYSPGQWFRAFIGYGAINPFDRGPLIHYRFFGPEIGIAQDIGDPYGFKLYYGVAMLTDIKRDAGKMGTARHTSYLPQGAVTYAF